MIAYTGIETISNMAEEAKDEATTIPRGDQPRRGRRVRDLRAAAGRRAVARCRSRRAPTASYTTLLGLAEDEGGFAGDPILGVVKSFDLGPLQGAGEVYVGLLAATILFIATNAGIIGVSRLVYSMGIHRQVPDRLRQLHPKFRTPWIGILIFGGRRLPRDDPRQGRVPRQHVRVRGDAVVHDRARGGRAAAAHQARPASGPTAGPGTLRVARARAAAVRARRRPRHGARVGHRDGAAPRRRRSPASAGSALGIVALRRLPPPPGARPDDDDARSRCRSRSSTTRPSTSRCSSPSTSATTCPRCWPPRSGSRPRRRRGIHVLVTITVPATSPIDAALPEQELRRAGDHRAGASCRAGGA